MAKKRAAPPVAPAQIPGELVGTINGYPIRRMKVEEIDAAHYNPREISEKALEGLRASVGEFGLVQPLIWNLRTRRLVGGHQRLKTLPAGSSTDLAQVDLDEVREMALNAALNDRSKQGDWTASVAELLDSIEQRQPELFGRLSFDDLRVEIPSLDLDVTGADDLGEGVPVSETIVTERQCPNCGHRFA